MASETNELTFVRCPTCRSLVPASASRCRICNATLEAVGEKSASSEGASASSRVRQKTVSATAEEIKSLAEGVSQPPPPASAPPPPPVQSAVSAQEPTPAPSSGSNDDDFDPLGAFLKDLDSDEPPSAPPQAKQPELKEEEVDPLDDLFGDDDDDDDLPAPLLSGDGDDDDDLEDFDLDIFDDPAFDELDKAVQSTKPVEEAPPAPTPPPPQPTKTPPSAPESRGPQVQQQARPAQSVKPPAPPKQQPPVARPEPPPRKAEPQKPQPSQQNVQRQPKQEQRPPQQQQQKQPQAESRPPQHDARKAGPQSPQQKGPQMGMRPRPGQASAPQPPKQSAPVRPREEPEVVAESALHVDEFEAAPQQQPQRVEARAEHQERGGPARHEQPRKHEPQHRDQPPYREQPQQRGEKPTRPDGHDRAGESKRDFRPGQVSHDGEGNVGHSERESYAQTGPKMNKMKPGRLFGWLVSFESPDGRAIELRSGRFFVTDTSIRGSDLILEDQSISTPHALMSISEKGFLLQDLMSERGTFVRPRGEAQYRREEGIVEVQHGDWVRFGDVEFLVTIVPG